eukprot:143025-Rhodomonas_salina.2
MWGGRCWEEAGPQAASRGTQLSSLRDRALCSSQGRVGQGSAVTHQGQRPRGFAPAAPSNAIVQSCCATVRLYGLLAPSSCRACFCQQEGCLPLFYYVPASLPPSIRRQRRSVIVRDQLQQLLPPRYPLGLRGLARRRNVGVKQGGHCRVVQWRR